ncbi:GNAT family N-acetyltransferase [Clostridium sp.]|uniref:GNAT family N-acetyltransferase n=1 Tax=Clostridium sp. TaxID=1506 RepID=UPI003217CCBA
MNFEVVLREKYLENPCSFQPTALWKTIKMTSNFKKEIKINNNEVLDWTKEKVFDNSLWVLVVENIKEMPIALGIAECDEDIVEGSLEWIQVLPQYRVYGIGAALVNFLLSILKEKSKFVTVSGKIDNKTNPQRMYRKCGFQGNDIWHILRRNL